MSTNPPSVTLTLKSSEIRLINTPVAGSGGFQSFARRLQKGLRGATLTLTDKDLGRAVRHMAYGRGGFEDRLRGALSRPLAHLVTAE